MNSIIRKRLAEQYGPDAFARAVIMGEGTINIVLQRSWHPRLRVGGEQEQNRAERLKKVEMRVDKARG